MNWSTSFAKRFLSLFANRRADRSLDAELQSHFEMLVDQNLQRGMTPDAARRAARLELGGADQIKESVHDIRGIPLLESIVADIRYALRMLRKSPGFTAVAILTLALGIGANTAVFSLIDAVLLTTLPVARPYELVLFSDSPTGGSASGAQTGRWDLFSSDNYLYFRGHSDSFQDLCAFEAGWTDLKIRRAGAAGRPDAAHGRLVSGNFFSLLELNAFAGRLFTTADDRLGAPPTVVLTYNYWSRKFHSDPSILGKALEINGTDYAVIGVAPRTFRDVKLDRPDMWFPLVFQPQIMADKAYADDPEEYWLNIIARLKPGVTLPQAQTVVNSQLKQILRTQAHPETSQQIANSYIQLAPGAYGISYTRSAYSQALHVLAAVVAIVLLIACANVANLLLSRAAAREQEISIRRSLGAGRARLFRQLLTESLLLAVLGGAVAILAARWGVQLLAFLALRDPSFKASLNANALLFTACVSILAGVVFGLVPALRSSRADLATRVKSSTSARLPFGVVNGLIVFQIAASVVLLIGAGLFLRTLRKLASQDLGFDEEHLLVARIDPQTAGYDPDQTPALYQALIDRIEGLSGVVSATVAYSEPLSGSAWTSNFSIEGVPPKPSGNLFVHKELVGPQYFQTEGIPILLGRDIGPQDRLGTPLVTVINQTMARQFFPGLNPIGKRFSLGSPFNPDQAMIIVGVAADARYYSLRDPVPPMEFCAAFQVPQPNSHNAAYARALEIRVAGSPRAIASEVPAAIAQVSASLPITRVTVLKEQVADSLWQNRGAAQLSTVFAAVALLLACIGVYGTTAHSVSRRTREIGIRIALGAQPSTVLWLFARQCLVLVAIGLVIGVSVALASSKIIANQLFGIRSNDPLTFSSVAVLLVGIALVACYIPARRAMSVDPVSAMRCE